MSTSIRQTVTDHLRSDYVAYGEAAITALQEREDAIVAALRDYAVSKGVSRSEIDALFTEVGLIEPTPEPETVAAVDESDPLARLERVVASLGEKVEKLIGVASRAGYPVS